METMKTITVRLPADLIKDLKIASKDEGQTISFIIRTVLKDYINYLKSWKDGNNE